MARLNPVPPEKIEECKQLRALREGLKIPRTVFAEMCGTNHTLLHAKESGRVPFRPAELQRIKEAVEKHLLDGFAAFRALPF